MDAILPASPQPNRILLRYSLNIYKLTFSKVFWLALLLSIVFFTPRISQDVRTLMGIHTVETFELFNYWLLLFNLVSLLIFIAILWRVYNAIHKHHETVGADIEIGLKRLISAFLGVLLESIVLVGLVYLIFAFEYLLVQNNLLFGQSLFSTILTIFIFVGQLFLILYAYTLFIFMIPIIALENRNLWSALKRSVILVWNHWWRTFSFQLTPIVVFVAILFILRFLIGLDVSLYPYETIGHNIVDTIIQLLILALFIPWVAAIILVQLRDLELRKNMTAKDKHAIR